MEGDPVDEEDLCKQPTPDPGATTLTPLFGATLAAPIPDRIADLLSSFDRLHDRHAAERLHQRNGLDSRAAYHMLAMLNDVRVATILLDEDKRVLFSNDAAQTLLKSGALTYRGTRLSASDRVVDLRLQMLLSQAVADGDHPPPASAETWLVAVPRLGARPLIARIISASLKSGGLKGRTRAIVVVIDPDNSNPPSADVLQRVFRVTPAETQVARQLVLGRSVEEIAELNCVSVGTIRLQLRSLFAKTGTSRQGELIALLSRLSIIAPCGSNRFLM